MLKYIGKIVNETTEWEAIDRAFYFFIDTISCLHSMMVGTKSYPPNEHLLKALANGTVKEDIAQEFARAWMMK